MIRRTGVWRDDEANLRIVASITPRPRLCAGGDMRALYESVQGDGRVADAFFDTEYKLNALINPTPSYVAFMDGVTMGSASTFAWAYRIVTSARPSRCRRPIGLFPMSAAVGSAALAGPDRHGWR
jgi:enoyl-CoA hydratase